MAPPEVLGVADLVWLQLDEQAFLQVTGARLDGLPFSGARNKGYETFMKTTKTEMSQAKLQMKDIWDKKARVEIMEAGVKFKETRIK